MKIFHRARGPLCLVLTLLLLVQAGGLTVSAADPEDGLTPSVLDPAAYTGGEILVLYQDGSCETVACQDDAALAETLAQLSARPDVALVQPNYTYESTALSTSDPLVGEQWALDNDGSFQLEEQENRYPVFDDPFDVPSAPWQWIAPWWMWSAGSSTAGSIQVQAVPGIDIGLADAWRLYDGGSRDVVVALVGGVLGVIFMVPLRQALIVEEHGVLPFPEGTACAEVLLAGEEGGSKAGVVFSGLGLAAFYKFVSDGLKIFPSEIGHDIAFYKGSSIGIQVLPALAGVGYICGPKISSFMFAGGTLSWFVIMPLIALFGGDAVVFPGTDPISTLAPSDLWGTYVKYIGAGAVATGGIISLIKSFPLIVRTFKQAMQGMTREYIEEMMLEGYAVEMGVDPETIRDYIADMDDETLMDYVREMTAEAVREQYADAARAQLAAMSAEQLAMALSMSPLTDEQYEYVYAEKLPPKYSESTYEENLELLGYVDKDSPSSISLYAASFADKDEIARIISEYNAAVEDEEDEISYTDYVAILMSSVSTIINAISYVLIAFVAISLIVSSIMIGIITYISVLERTKEIGILRSIGASKRDVSNVFNAETLIEGFAAGVIGIGITLLLIIPINAIVQNLTGIESLRAILPASGGVALVVISMILTFIAGLIPSGFAARRDPVEALRTE